MNSERKVARIVTPALDENGLTPTQMTKVFVGDVEIKGITKIELICEVGDVWRGTITMMVQPPVDFSASAVFKQPSLWDRLKQWCHDLVRPAHGFDFPR